MSQYEYGVELLREFGFRAIDGSPRWTTAMELSLPAHVLYALVDDRDVPLVTFSVEGLDGVVDIGAVGLENLYREDEVEDEDMRDEGAITRFELRDKVVQLAVALTYLGMVWGGDPIAGLLHVRKGASTRQPRPLFSVQPNAGPMRAVTVLQIREGNFPSAIEVSAWSEPFGSPRELAPVASYLHAARHPKSPGEFQRTIAVLLDWVMERGLPVF